MATGLTDYKAVGYGETRQWIPPFSLLDNNGATLFSVDSSGNVSFAGSSSPSGNLTITNAAPAIHLVDSTASAKSLQIKADANSAQMKEDAGADNSLLVLDLANNRVGVAMAPARALDVTGTFGATGAATLGSTLGVTGTSTLAATGVTGGLTSDTINCTGAATLATVANFTGIETGLTAHAGGGQASALALSATKTVHNVSTVGTAADSVVLPAATGSGVMHFVKNSAAANSMQVFAVSASTIDGVATATGVAIAAGKSRIFIDAVSGNWVSLLGA